MSRERAGRRRAPPRAPAPRSDVLAGRRAVAEALRAGAVQEVWVVASPTSTPGLRAVIEAAEEAGVAVRTMPRGSLDRLAADHQGVVAKLGAASSPALSERDLATFPFDDDALVVVLDGITDPQNLGAAARSAEAAGASALVSRTRRAAEVTPAAVRASAGALMHLPHARVANVARAIDRLHEIGFWVVGLDERASASVYDETCPPGRIAIVVGGEGEGMARLTRERCDALVALPMRGRVGSLNAAASLAAVLYAFVVPRGS